MRVLVDTFKHGSSLQIILMLPHRTPLFASYTDAVDLFFEQRGTVRNPKKDQRAPNKEFDWILDTEDYSANNVLARLISRLISRPLFGSLDLGFCSANGELPLKTPQADTTR